MALLGGVNLTSSQRCQVDQYIHFYKHRLCTTLLKHKQCNTIVFCGLFSNCSTKYNTLYTNIDEGIQIQDKNIRIKG